MSGFSRTQNSEYGEIRGLSPPAGKNNLIRPRVKDRGNTFSRALNRVFCAHAQRMQTRRISEFLVPVGLHLLPHSRVKRGCCRIIKVYFFHKDAIVTFSKILFTFFSIPSHPARVGQAPTNGQYFSG